VLLLLLEQSTSLQWVVLVVQQVKETRVVLETTPMVVLDRVELLSTNSKQGEVSVVPTVMPQDQLLGVSQVLNILASILLLSTSSTINTSLSSVVQVEEEEVVVELQLVVLVPLVPLVVVEVEHLKSNVLVLGILQEQLTCQVQLVQLPQT
jgi:hypothetical protein